MGDLPLLPAPQAPFAPTTSAEVFFHSQDPGNNFNVFSLDPSPAPSAPQGPSTPAALPPTWHRAVTTTLGLGQPEGRPKGQQTVGSRPHASRLRIQLCFHGNVQSRGSTVPSRSSRAPCSVLDTAKSSRRCPPRPGLPAVTLRAPSKARQIRAHRFPTHDVPARKRQIKMRQLIAVTEITPPIAAEL